MYLFCFRRIIRINILVAINNDKNRYCYNITIIIIITICIRINNILFNKNIINRKQTPLINMSIYITMDFTIIWLRLCDVIVWVCKRKIYGTQ